MIEQELHSASEHLRKGLEHAVVGGSVLCWMARKGLTVKETFEQRPESSWEPS